MSTPDHQGLRELLGAYALGHLAAAEEQTVRAHLDGCASCRTELAELEPLVGLLDAVDPAHFDTPPHPPADLGLRIQQAISSEARRPAAVVRPAGRRLARVAAAVAAAVAVGVSGGLVGRGTAPPPPSSEPDAPQLEAVVLEPPRGSGGPDVESAGLVSHTWGVELRIVADGFPAGETFRAAFRDEASGELRPAGAFIGTGPVSMTCNLQSAILRDDVSEVVVLDADGDEVLGATL